jgi:hypothetical protein
VPQEATIPAIAHAIQLAVAPVFLLSGIGAFLGVLTNRLARVVDRSRVLSATDGPAGAGRAPGGELPLLHRRIRAINRAITLCTYSALLVAGVVVALFVGALTPYSLAPAVGVLFVVAMVALIGGLTSFLQEIHIATRQFRDAADAGR